MTNVGHRTPAGWVRSVPFVVGVLASMLAIAFDGYAGILWLAIGCFCGGWVPLYLMPWLRSRRV